MNTKLSRAVSVTFVTLMCVLALSMGVASQARAAGKPPGLRPAPAAMTWLKDAQIAPRVYAYPSSFDLRDLGKVSPVRNQNPWGTCWAFAALGSLESNLLPAETWDFSEDNLVYYSGFDGATDYYQGGNSYMAAAYLTRWSGPFTEAQDPYNDGSHPQPSALVAQKHVQDVVFLPTRSSDLDNNDIKYALTTWGGVYMSMYFDERPAYWNTGTDSYYYNGSNVGNHGILVVGWDDDYPASKFADHAPRQRRLPRQEQLGRLLRRRGLLLDVLLRHSRRP